MKERKDFLNRTEDKERVLNIIRAASSRKESLSFAIDGRWGSGKSFFIDLVQKDLIDDHFVFKYDSWDNDYYDDPLIGMLDSIKDQLNKTYALEKGLKETQKELVKRIIDAIGSFLDGIISSKIGIKPIKAVKTIKDFMDRCSQKAKISDDFNPNNKIKAAKQLIVASMNELANIKPIVFMVDEIDRCFPTYTLKILERIHHISENVDPCITVFSVDTNQLQRIIELVYDKEPEANKEGEKDVVKGYLRKVIDFTYDLGVGNLSDDFFDEFEDYKKRFNDPIKEVSREEIKEFLRHLFEGMDARSSLKLINDTKYVHDLVFGDKRHTEELMLGELMFGWATKEYGGNVLVELRKDINRGSGSKRPFIKYLSDSDKRYGQPYYNDRCDKSICPVYDLKSLVKYFAFYPNYWHSYDGRFLHFSVLPPFMGELTNEYVECLAKIKC